MYAWRVSSRRSIACQAATLTNRISETSEQGGRKLGERMWLSPHSATFRKRRTRQHFGNAVLTSNISAGSEKGKEQPWEGMRLWQKSATFGTRRMRQHFENANTIDLGKMWKHLLTNNISAGSRRARKKQRKRFRAEKGAPAFRVF